MAKRKRPVKKTKGDPAKRRVSLVKGKQKRASSGKRVQNRRVQKHSNRRVSKRRTNGGKKSAAKRVTRAKKPSRAKRPTAKRAVPRKARKGSGNGSGIRKRPRGKSDRPLRPDAARVTKTKLRFEKQGGGLREYQGPSFEDTDFGDFDLMLDEVGDEEQFSYDSGETSA